MTITVDEYKDHPLTPGATSARRSCTPSSCIRQLAMLFERRFPGETLSICLPDWYTTPTSERSQP